MASSEVIFGVDISSGSIRGKDPRYSLVILDGEAERQGNVSLTKLFRLIRQYEPRVLAVDNVYELAEDREDLDHLLRSLPGETMLVQVTGAERPEKLPVVARRHGIHIDPSDSMQEAEACALLAAAGVGFRVSAYEDRTYIKVSRGRSVGKGGWSQDRYRRKIHGAVRARTREIESYLKSEGFTYDRQVKKGYGGLVRGEFVVDAPISEVSVHGGRDGDVQVHVSPIERDGLDFIPLSLEQDYVIVGVDPGTTTGVAILDLEGRALSVVSSRTMSQSDVIEHITEYGKPLIVASDVRPMPETVEKIRRSFGAVSYEPAESLSTEAKNDLARGASTQNDHERDALAAARDAYAKHRNKFQQIMRKTPPGVDAGEVIALVTHGESIGAAITKVTMEDEEEDEKTQRRLKDEVQGLRKALRGREEEIEDLHTEIDRLKEQLQEKDRVISKLRRKLKERTGEVAVEARKEHEVRIRDEEIRRLKKTLRDERERLNHAHETMASLRRIRNLELSGDVTPMKVLSSFSREDIEELDERLGIKRGDVLLIEDPSGGGHLTVDLLKEKGVRAVVIEGEMSHMAREAFFEHGIPVLTDVKVQRADTHAAANKHEIREAIQEWREWAERERQRRETDKIEAMFKEYKNERARE